MLNLGTRNQLHLVSLAAGIPAFEVVAQAPDPTSRSMKTGPVKRLVRSGDFL